MQENTEIQKSEEYQYLQLIKDILENGNKETTRNGTTFSLFGRTMRFSLKDNKIPILTTKRVENMSQRIIMVYSWQHR